MKRVGIFLYGLVCYGVFFLTFLYAVGFVGNLLVPKTVDEGVQGGGGFAWLVDILLLSVFALQHSIMARQGFKRSWTRMVPRTVERSGFLPSSHQALMTSRRLRAADDSIVTLPSRP